MIYPSRLELILTLICKYNILMCCLLEISVDINIKIGLLWKNMMCIE